MAELFLQGAQVGLNAANLMQRRLQFEREQKLKEQLLPMQQETELLNAAEKFSSHYLKQQDRQAVGLFTTLVAQIAEQQIWDSPKAKGAIWNFASKYPQIVESDVFKTALKYTDLASDAAEQKKPYEPPPAPPGMDPTSVTIHTPKGSATFTGENTANKPLSTIGRLIFDRNAAFTAGDKAAVSQYDAAIQKSVTPTGMTIKTNADGTVEVTQGAIGDKLPAGITTKVMERLGQSEKAITEMNDLAISLRPEDVGFKGVVGEQLLDKVLPQFGVASADMARMDNRTKLKTLIEGMLRQVSADSRFSNADRTDIKAILPSSGTIESYENTQQTIKTLRKIMSKRALIDAREGSLPAPPWALRNLDALALAESFRAGLITKEEALRAFDANHP